MLSLILSTQLLLEPKLKEQKIQVEIDRPVMQTSSTIHLERPALPKTEITLQTKGSEAHMIRAEEAFREEQAEKARQWKLRLEKQKKQEEKQKRQEARQKKREAQLLLVKQKAAALLKRKKAQHNKPVLQKTSASTNATQRRAEVTAYYAAPDRMQGGGITATGHNLYESNTFKGYRIVAAPPEIPFGSILEFNMDSGKSYRAVVLDRGGRIHNGVFDLALSSRQECILFGRQHGTYRVIGHVPY